MRGRRKTGTARPGPARTKNHATARERRIVFLQRILIARDIGTQECRPPREDVAGARKWVAKARKATLGVAGWIERARTKGQLAAGAADELGALATGAGREIDGR